MGIYDVRKRTDPRPVQVDERASVARESLAIPRSPILTTSLLHVPATESPREAQLKQNDTSLPDQSNSGPIQLSGDEKIVQRVVAPSYTKLNAWDPGTPIPVNDKGQWKRPSWLRDKGVGENTPVETMIEDLITSGKVKRSPTNASLFFDVYTGAWVSTIGMSIDHIIDWAEFGRQQGVQDRQELEESYHEMDNLTLSGSRVNSAMGQVDSLEWMAGPKHTKIMNALGNAKGGARLNGFMDEVVGVNPNLTMSEIPLEKRYKLLMALGTIQNPRESASVAEPLNAFSLMMAYRDARGVVGVDTNTPPDRDDVEDPDAMDED